MTITRDLSGTFSSVRGSKGARQVFVNTFEVDFSDTDMSLAQNEVMEICVVPAGTLVLSAGLYVVTAETEITDVDLGVSTDANTSANLIDGVSLASTGYVAGNVDLSATGGGVWVTAESKLKLTNKDAQTLNAAKVKVILVCVDVAAAL